MKPRPESGVSSVSHITNTSNKTEKILTAKMMDEFEDKYCIDEANLKILTEIFNKID
jgi:hypothetical protein